MKLRVELDPVEFDFEGGEQLESDDDLKEWLWKHHGREILRSAKVTQAVNGSSLAGGTSIIPASGQSSSVAKGDQDNMASFDQNRRLELLDTIAQVQRVFLDSESLCEAFGSLLSGLLSLVGSEYGFIGEVKYTEDGDMYLQIHSRASTSFKMDPMMRHFFERNEKEVVKLYNLHSLFGECLLTKKPVLSNDVNADSRSGGVPPGHPYLNKFLGVPFFKQHGEILGIVGVANKPGGYTEGDVDLLGPFVLTCSSVIQAHRQIQRNENLIDDLEEKVKERTLSLQQANQDLAQANARVLKASAAQLEHFACMSHEIRTPLNCIIGLSSLLQESDLNPMQDEAVRMIVQSGDLLLTVVNDVLDYSKLESGNVEIEIQRASLQETLNALVHSIAMKAQGKNISLRTLYDVLLPEFLDTDSRRVQQILYNLLGNALKFSVDGSVVDLRVELSDGEVMPDAYSPCPLVIQDGKQRRFIRFTVKDYGRGIARTDFARIFEPFQQATYETEQVYGGTGLGLAITAKLVHGLGGQIHVDSVGGQWSRFTVDLPYDGPMPEPVKLGENLQDCTIFLICDDNAVAIQVAQTFRECQVQYARFKSSDEMEAKITCEGFLDRGRTYVCLVQENLFSDVGFDTLTELSGRAILLTFGPRFDVTRSQGHYRSLVQMIPSVLVKSIGSYAVSGATRKILPRRRSFVPDIAARYQEYSILVAEDNIINQKVLVRMLKRIGINSIDVVENGKQAVEAERNKCYDVVLMDMQMPVMDGLEACELITDRATGHRLASVVFVTAHVSPSFEARCERAGASGFLPKPFNISDIEQCLQNMYMMRDGEFTSVTAEEDQGTSDSSSLSDSSSPASYP